jgi:hypothetical protein
LHSHCPDAHAWPLAHETHAAPPVPHAVCVSPPSATHAPLAQQPLHVLASHLQTPARHAWPAAHFAQVAPLAPHDALVGVTHAPVAGSQQPWQFDGPHEQVAVAVWQWIPDGQSPSLEQPQRPAVQTFPTAEAVQSTQPAPPAPHAEAESPPTQWPAWQQPLAHMPSPLAPHASEQTPLEQVGVMPLQPAHAPPAVPHSMLLC